MSEAQTITPKVNSKLVLFVQAYILVGLIAFGLLYAHDASEFQPDELLRPGCALLLGLTIWFFGSWYFLTNRLFDPYLLFLISAILFNGGQALLEVFQLNKNGFLDDQFPDDMALATLYLVILGLCSLHLGAILSVLLSRQTAVSEPIPNQNAFDQRVLQLRLQSAFSVGQKLFYISILPTVLILKDAIAVVLAGGYFALYEQQAATGWSTSAEKLADFIFPGAFFMIAGGQQRQTMRWLAVLAILLYSGAKFFLGTRGAAIMPLLAMLWLWNGAVRPVPKWLLLSFAVVMLGIIFPLVGAIRNETGADRLSLEFLIDRLAGANNPAVASIAEMGGSMRTIAWTMQLVPSVRPFALGMTYLTGVLILIPNVFSAGRHPALTWSGYDIPDFWLVWEIEPEFAERGGSFGFSFIAEAYLNFGWLGAPLLLGLLGFLYGKFVIWAIRDNDPIKMAFLATFVSSFLFYARGSSEMVIRPFIWYSLLPYLWFRFTASSKLGKSNSLIRSREGDV
jgi:oligosaccharide repeat unit polymerase